MFEIEATVNVPYEFCQYCGLLDLRSETLYANGRPFMTVMRCENAGVCQNAVELMEEHEKERMHGNNGKDQSDRQTS